MIVQSNTVLITGASRGLGANFSKVLAQDGFQIIGVGRNIRNLKSVISSLPNQDLGHSYLELDITDELQVQRMLNDLNIYALINNAGIANTKLLHEETYSDLKKIIDINLLGSINVSNALIPNMIKNKYGSIVALGGMATLTGRPNTAPVASSKMAVLGLIKSIASEFSQYNIRANMVNPGSIDTERMHPEWYPEYAKDGRNSPKHLNKIPLGRQGHTQDIANACLFLASDESSYITGDQINAVGGRFMVTPGEED